MIIQVLVITHLRPYCPSRPYDPFALCALMVFSNTDKKVCKFGLRKWLRVVNHTSCNFAGSMIEQNELSEKLSPIIIS